MYDPYFKSSRFFSDDATKRLPWMDIGPEQVSSVAKATRLSMLAYMFNVAVAVAALHGVDAIPTLLVWAALSASAPAIVLYRTLRARPANAQINTQRGIRRAMVIAILLGLPWGLLGVIFAGSLPFTTEVLVYALIIGMSASGSLLLAPIAPAALCYVAAVLLPLLASLAHTATFDSLLIALLVASFGAFLVVLIAANAQLSIQRSRALHELNSSRNDLDQLNQTLEEKAAARSAHLVRQQSVIGSLMSDPEVRDGNSREAMQVIVRTLSRELGVDRCGYWLINSQCTGFSACNVYDQQKDTFTTPRGWNAPQRFETMLRVSSRKIIAIDDTRLPHPLHEINPIAYLPFDIRSTIQAPILSHGEHIGFITCSTVGRTMSWSADQKMFVFGLVNLAALALERQQRRNLEADAVHRAHRLSCQQQTINDLMRMEVEGSAMEEVLAMIASGVRLGLDVDRVSIRLLDQDIKDHAVTVAFSNNKSAPTLDQPEPGDPSYPTALRTALLDGPVAIFDCRTDPLTSTVYKTRLEPRDIQSALHAPILIGRKLIGFVACSTIGHKRKWHPEDTVLAIGAANLAALAIERRRREQTEFKLREANEVKGQFLRNMSHELRTPLNGIFGMTELLESSKLSERQRTLLESMKQSSQQLLHVTNDILDVSRATNGALTIDHHELDLGICIEEAVDLLVGEAKAKGLTLAVDVSPDVVGTTQGDFGRLKQVLVNLLGNAIKFTSSGTVELRVSPARTTRGVTHVRFEISDTGSGIPSAVMSKLFQPFVQSDTSLSRRFGGTGLGLAISRQLVELMGGKLSLESAAGKGTLATFVLPMAIVGASNAETLGAPAEYPPSAAATTDEADYGTNSWAQKLGWQVLVAEDNPVNQAVIEEYLGNLGCTFSVVDNGALAVRAFEQGSFDIILMDCQMPEMDGLEATRRIRALEKQRGTPPMPIIAVTAHAFEEDRNECVEAGMNGFVSKPCSLEMLAITMQQCAPGIARLGETKRASTAAKPCRSSRKVEKSARTVRPGKPRTKDAKEPVAATG